MAEIEKTAENELLRILNTTAVDVIDVLADTSSDAKEEFLNDSSLLRPRNQYGQLNRTQIEENLKTLSLVEELLLKCDVSDIKKDFYRSIFCNNLNQNQFALANAQYNDSKTDQERTLAAEQHRKSNIALYGPVNEDIFWSILNAKLEQIQARTLSAEEMMQKRKLLSMLGPVKTAEHTFFTPKNETFAEFSKCIESYFEGFFRHIPANQETFTVWEVCDITNQILQDELSELGKGWKAVVKEHAAYASADSEKMEIAYPGKRSRGLYSFEDVRGVIVHELGVHALRSMPFMNHPISAISRGLPGYEVFEEGLATAVECCAKGKFSLPGFLHYVSIGLATFLKKNFREVFEIQVRLERLTNGAGPSQCFDSVQRAFRGTGILPNNKDLIYLHGNVLVWKFIEDHLDDKENLLFQLFKMGKSNPMNETHRKLCTESPQ